MLKSLLKQLLHLFMLLLLSPLIIIFLLLKPICNKDSLFAGFSQLLSLFPGLIGSYLRVAGYRFTMQSCATNCYIGFGALFSQQGTEIKPGAYIGPQCNIGLSIIGENTLLGSGVHILSGKNQHRFSASGVPYKDQGGSFEKVSIGENCWLGNGAIVMASIGDGTIVGAGSVVTNPLPPGVIAVGNPAKVVRYLNEHVSSESTA